jgi:hypothetical protein
MEQGCRHFLQNGQRMLRESRPLAEKCQGFGQESRQQSRGGYLYINIYARLAAAGGRLRRFSSKRFGVKRNRLYICAQK